MHCLVSKVSTKYIDMHHIKSYKLLKGAKSRKHQLKVAEQNNSRRIVSHEVSLFGKMPRGRSASFELFQLDMYVNTKIYWYTNEANE